MAATPRRISSPADNRIRTTKDIEADHKNGVCTVVVNGRQCPKKHDDRLYNTKRHNEKKHGIVIQAPPSSTPRDLLHFLTLVES